MAALDASIVVIGLPDNNKIVCTPASFMAFGLYRLRLNDDNTACDHRPAGGFVWPGSSL